MINPDILFNKGMDAAERYADEDHAYGVLEDTLSTLEGVLIAEGKAKGLAITILPKLIKSDKRWVDMANSVRDARKAALIAKLKYEQVLRYMDNVRTKESTERKFGGPS